LETNRFWKGVEMLERYLVYTIASIISFWGCVKIVDRTNRAHTVLGSVIIGLIIGLICMIPIPILFLLLLLGLLAIMFNSYDLNIIEGIISLVLFIFFGIVLIVGYYLVKAYLTGKI